MTQNFTVCVFCSASDALDEGYKICAQETGSIIAQQGLGIVYGGASIGMMGIVANAALAHGGKVTGVIPENLKDREIAHNGLTKLEICTDMHERQKRMADLADAFVVLPGGMGTMAEFFEVLTWKQLGLHNKPIALINHDGYWDGLITQMQQALDEHFLHSNDPQLYKVFDSMNDVPEFLKDTA